jgi:hypothetical protein
LWLIAVFPDKVADDRVAQLMLKSAKLAFFEIATSAPSDQIKMGRRVLKAAFRNPGLAADPKTEPSL